MSRRAGLLADRIEEGAANLAAFAEALSEAEWRAGVTEGGKDGRSVGVVVHHVASVYPIEVDLARAIAAGKAVTEVTWEVVADLNASTPTIRRMQRRPPHWNFCAGTVARPRTRYAPSAMRSWTAPRPSH